MSEEDHFNVWAAGFSAGASDEATKQLIIKLWAAVNKRRNDLIAKDVLGTPTAEEKIELDALQKLADEYIRVVTPIALDEIAAELGMEAK